MSAKPRITGRATRDWQDLDARHYMHPFTDFRALAAEGSRVITHAEGVHLYDSEGQEILDAMSGLWCVNIGYGRNELADAAAKQMRELPYYNSFFKSANPPAIELAKLLDEVTPKQFHRVFFTQSGSEANDTIIRMTRRYWDLLGQPKRSVIISRINAYHGSTMGGASLSGMAAMHAQGGLPIPDIVHIEQPYWYENGIDLSPEEYGLRAARRLAEKIEEIGPERVAAFIGEPVQGAGGVIVPPSTYWPEIQRICREYGILLISDEVICGFGRTGQWFGCEHFGVEPDFMTIAKGITSGYQPLGGVMVSDRVAERPDREGRRVRARLHLVRPPGLLRGRDREPRRSCAARRSSSARATRSRRTSRSAFANSPTIGSSAKCAGSACWARSSSSRTRAAGRSSATAGRSASSAATTASRTA